MPNVEIPDDVDADVKRSETGKAFKPLNKSEDKRENTGDVANDSDDGHKTHSFHPFIIQGTKGDSKRGGDHMSENKMSKLLRASEIIKQQDEKETELDNLVAISMQTGYELGRLAKQAQPA